MNARGLGVVGLGLIVSFAMGAAMSPVSAQDLSDPRSSDKPAGNAADALLDGVLDQDLKSDCPGAEVFGGTVTERRAYCLLYDLDKRITLRRLSEQAVRESPESFRAQFLMGYSQHVGEGNLPKSLFHLEEAERLLVARFGRFPPAREFAGLQAYRMTLLELVYVHGEMDHHERKITYVDELRKRLDFDYSPMKAWPLLKLKRFDEAREVAESGLAENAGDPSWEAISLTALCAVYSEARRREDAYRACQAAAEPALSRGVGGGVSLSNAAAAAMEMFKFDEAERLYLEATRRRVEATINPWGRLAQLYLRQGRFAEAVSALREMKAYRQARPPYFDQQDQTDAELTGAAVLIIAGRTPDALRITKRTANRPDRQGTSSAAFEQNEAGNLLTDRVVRLDVARRLEEQASWSIWSDAAKLRVRALRLRVSAWLAERRAASLLSDPERLLTSLRPECPGSVELPVWLDGEVVQIVGPGVALSAIEEVRGKEELAPRLATPIFEAFEAEAYFEKGDYETALEYAQRTVKSLSPVETLHRARVAAIGAASAFELGQNQVGMGLLQQVLGMDPGVIRRLGQTVPVRFVAQEETRAVREAIDMLRSSPRFDEEPWGFQIGVSEQFVTLSLDDGSEIFRTRVKPGKSDTVEDVARRIARATHFDLMVPKLDITQADIRSLDGGLIGGGRASEKAKSVLDEILDSRPRTPASRPVAPPAP